MASLDNLQRRVRHLAQAHTATDGLGQHPSWEHIHAWEAMHPVEAAELAGLARAFTLAAGRDDLTPERLMQTDEARAFTVGVNARLRQIAAETPQGVDP